jgi:hypothetical protein
LRKPALEVRWRTVAAYSYFELRFILLTDYIWISRYTMADTYRMTVHGAEFIIGHDDGGTVEVYKTEKEARQGIVKCQRDDLMLKTARALVKKAVNALMRAHQIDRRAAQGWIREAAD